LFDGAAGALAPENLRDKKEEKADRQAGPLSL
jgi:hypothetical protein